MKTSHLSTEARVVLGALAASFAACSAQSSGTPPRGTGGSGNSAAAGNTGFNGAAGSTANNGAAGNTGFNGAAGSTANNGAAGSTGSGFGTAGSTGSGFGAGGSTSSGGGATGTAGAGAGVMSCGTLTQSPADMACCIAAGTTANLGIDSLEDLDNVILPVEQRQGYWYTYSDKQVNPASVTTLMPSAAKFPPAMGGHACSLLPFATDCAGALGAAGVAGSMVGSAEISGVVAAATAMTATAPAVSTYVGLGFDLNNHFNKSCPYNATVYKGITFWAKGSPLKAEVTIPATLPPSPLHTGTCTGTCNDNYFKQVTPLPDGSWGQFTITFTDPLFAQAGWGTPATFTPSSIVAVQFQIDGTTTQTAPAAYDFAVDDVAFF